MPDKTIHCVSCGRVFVWAEHEQKFYAERGYDPPKRCKECRAADRAVGRDAARSVVAPPSAPRPRFRELRARFVSVALLAAFAVMAGLIWVGTAVVFAWLIAINAVTFLTFGYDKTLARSGALRVPEQALLLLALAGGSLGALAGMELFRHKTAKPRFRAMFWAIMAVQVFALYLYFRAGK